MMVAGVNKGLSIPILDRINGSNTNKTKVAVAAAGGQVIGGKGSQEIRPRTAIPIIDSVPIGGGGSGGYPYPFVDTM